MSGYLPLFRNSTDAALYGRHMTWHQAQKLCRKRQAIQSRFRKEKNLQKKLFMAVDIQLIREALEAWSKNRLLQKQT